MSVASAARPLDVVADERVVLDHVSWETYESLLDDDVERRVPRITYDQGAMELVTPSMPHEEDADTIAQMVKIVSAVAGISIRSVASTTFRRRDLQRGFEPDASFYIQNAPRIRGQREVDLAIDPPPDLVLEMEMSRSALNKLALFADMGIPEVWRCDGEDITILLLHEDEYRAASASFALPVLTGEVLSRFLTESRTLLSPEWFRMVSEWSRAQTTESP
jgi:Uma2 family endonuclease